MKNDTFWQPVLTAGAVLLGVKMFLCRQSDIKRKSSTKKPGITKEEVAEVQEQWGLSLVNIGKAYATGGDYKSEARSHIDKFYAYDDGIVLFKPTMACQKQFRTDKEGALSYFIGGFKDYPEDHGFALRPWQSVRWENIGTIIKENLALAMGNYYFTAADGSPEVKVEYSFAFSRDQNGNLRIILHDSHIPFHPDR